ncbi:MAG TPA: hypothetical protein ENJ09_03730, partial [Planctomycetes bacterium]|nr:hypothetical protein [Planctomycetota bacterium]
MIRQPISIFLLRFVAPLLASLAFAAHPAAQISLSGSVFDGSGGPLLTGQIYHLTGNVTVPTGQTLTVQAGAIVKSPSFQISVAGSMIVQGTALDPAIFTSLEDDSAGGDSNGNGPSSGSPGDWVGISVNSSGTLMADHMVVRYAGMGSAGGLNNQGVLSLSNSTVQDSLFTGLRLNMSQSILGVTGCTFQDNGSYAVEGVRLDVVPAFSNNTASGNGLGDYMRIQHAMPAMDTTITTANLIGGVAVITANSTIPSGVTLRMEAGVVVKWAGNLRQTVDGTLELAGTVANPVVYTVLEDDDYGGDTNKDGPSSGVPGAWQGILNNNGGAVNANESILRYAGSGFLGAIQSTGVLTLTNSTLSDSFTTPLKLALSAQVP